eukprot:CAMPEP_0170304390 /NCGR_PEP_ID=MMETSP0116_2-20130129/52537_1 /TAXON_ID=400756 /ORGANISM="Durinskia baltica, Strain CSIRO CS-38" /LENGTH=62 /DNA_ID=CAMNT_0010556377 /DNA_START=46 /DNA_END=234 /DNA_ORIENTATION=-
MSHKKDMPAMNPMRSSGGVKRKFAKWKKVHMLQYGFMQSSHSTENFRNPATGPSPKTVPWKA